MRIKLDYFKTSNSSSSTFEHMPFLLARFQAQPSATISNHAAAMPVIVTRAQSDKYCQFWPRMNKDSVSCRLTNRSSLLPKFLSASLESFLAKLLRKELGEL